jgi:hypothetical protein
MKAVLPVLLITVILSGCSESVNYDIEEVAPAEFISGEEEPHDEETCTHPGHDHDHGEEAEEIVHDLGLHQHGAGIRNHGTEWFFNQPWAATFVWGKMLRDSIILLILAVSLYLLPRLMRKRKQ